MDDYNKEINDLIKHFNLKPNYNDFIDFDHNLIIVQYENTNNVKMTILTYNATGLKPYYHYKLFYGMEVFK